MRLWEGETNGIREGKRGGGDGERERRIIADEISKMLEHYHDS